MLKRHLRYIKAIAAFNEQNYSSNLLKLRFFPTNENLLEVIRNVFNKIFTIFLDNSTSFSFSSRFFILLRYDALGCQLAFTIIRMRVE